MALPQELTRSLTRAYLRDHAKRNPQTGAKRLPHLPQPGFERSHCTLACSLPVLKKHRRQWGAVKRVVGGEEKGWVYAINLGPTPVPLWHVGSTRGEGKQLIGSVKARQTDVDAGLIRVSGTSAFLAAICTSF